MALLRIKDSLAHQLVLDVRVDEAGARDVVRVELAVDVEHDGVVLAARHGNVHPVVTAELEIAGRVEVRRRLRKTARDSNNSPP